MTGIKKVERYAFNLYSREPINEETCKDCEYRSGCISLNHELMSNILRLPDKLFYQTISRSILLKGRSKFNLNVTAKLARDLRGFPKEKMKEVMVDVMGLSEDIAFEIIETAKAYPKKSMEEIHNIISKKREDGWWQSRAAVQLPNGSCCVRWVEYKRA